MKIKVILFESIEECQNSINECLKSFSIGYQKDLAFITTYPILIDGKFKILCTLGTNNAELPKMEVVKTL